jgi:predicted DNA-binding transcriptional regulator
MNDKTTGWTVIIGSILSIIIYFYLIFLSPWSSLTIKVSAFFAVGAVLLIIAWIGYTLATTQPPMPLEDLNLDDAETES